MKQERSGILKLTFTAALMLCFFGMQDIPVEACRICFLLPIKTPADFLIESEFVVFARENPDQPFSYSAIEILKGDSANDNLDLFVDSATRHRLKANPDNVVVLVRKNKDAPWKSLGLADNQYQEIVKRILAFASEWTGEGGLQQRCKFFLLLFGNKDLKLHELAYLELGRAPYSTIKKIAKFVSKDDIRPMLHRREYFEWRPLAILLVAQDPGEQDRQLIENSFRSCHKFALTTNLAAWATALIEIDGHDALDEIEKTYLRDSSRTDTEVRAVIIALSVHGRSGRPELRERIVESYGVALQHHPQVTGLIANDLTQWNKRVYHNRISEIIENSNFQFDAVETKAIKDYLK